MRWGRIFGCALSVVVMAGCTNAASDQQSTPGVSETSAMPTAAASEALPSATASERPFAADFFIVQVDGLNLREGPGTNQPVQTVGPGSPTSGQPIQLNNGEGVWVLNPEEVNGETWYQVITDGAFLPGWVSAGPDKAWVTPFEASSCPASATDAVGTGFLRDRPMHGLACFGAGDLVMVVYWPTAGEAGYDSPCPFGDARSKWVLCYEYVNTAGDGTRSLPVYGTTELPDFLRGAPWKVTGHLDDARASDCPAFMWPDTLPSELAAVLFCRTRFVVDSVEQPPAT